jgi:Tfp pilus assembly protein PilF
MTVSARYIGLFCGVLLLFGVGGCSHGTSAKKKGEYHYQMGLSNLGEGNPTGALIAFTEAEKYDPDNPDLQNYLGLAYLGKGRADLAESRFLRALALRPAFSDARNNLGVCYLELKRWDDAIIQFKQVTDDLFYQNQESATINLGLAYLGKGDYPKALSLIRSVVAANPANAKAHFNLGRIYVVLDKNDLATVSYRRAIELNPDYVAARYQLALLFLKNKDGSGAREQFEEVVRIAPDSELGQLAREQLDLLK